MGKEAPLASGLYSVIGWLWQVADLRGLSDPLSNGIVSACLRDVVDVKIKGNVSGSVLGKREGL